MERTLARQAPQQVGREVTLKGWVDSRRDHGKLIFIDLRDRTGSIQLVCGQEAKNLRDEFVIEVIGTVQKRKEGSENSDLETGKVEIKVSGITVLAESKTPPLPLKTDGRDIEENVRLKYRYLDLRRPRMTKNIRLRSEFVRRIREFLHERDFVEIETPLLSKSTPEGARDFLVPCRLQPGKFYALPQSPQQYKQMLMVAGFERYFQLARCLRDEDLRADRSFEFTQLDLEMSFVSQEDILALTEELLTTVIEDMGFSLKEKPFPRFTYEEAIKQFGDDKFDLRTSEEKEAGVLAFAWVTGFPLFEKTKDKEITSSHHPFTAPVDEDIPLLDTDPMKVRSWQHDLVCNGYEVAGGSIRITDPAIQEKIFEILGHSSEEIKTKFGHLLTAFEYGVPPHGGIAPGIDRLMACLMGESSLKEVTAFPQTSSGRTSVMDAPCEVGEEQLRELGIVVKVPPNT